MEIKGKKELFTIVEKSNHSKEVKDLAKKRLKAVKRRQITTTKKLNSYLNSLEDYLKFKKGLLKNVVGIETHRYSPELNKLILNVGEPLSVPNKTTIEEAIMNLFLTNKQ